MNRRNINNFAGASQRFFNDTRDTDIRSHRPLSNLRQQSKRIVRSSRKVLNDEASCLSCSFCVSLILFMGLFFGLVYPEILLTNYIEVPECGTVSTDVVSRYECSYSCPGCSEAPPGVSTCNSKVSQFESLDPEKCGAGDSNHCVENGASCHAGYECCATICQTCRSCSSSPKGGISCYSYVCNCVCISSVSREHCNVNCYTAYSGKLTLFFNKIDGEEQQSHFLKDFDKDIQGAQDFIANYTVGKSITCWYNPDNPSQVLIDGDVFTDWKLYVTGFLGILPLFLTLVVATHFTFRSIVDSFKMDEDLHFYINWWFWIGIILPLVVALPIMEHGYEVNQEAWKITIIVLLSLGNVPIICVGVYYFYLWVSDRVNQPELPFEQEAVETGASFENVFKENRTELETT